MHIAILRNKMKIATNARKCPLRKLLVTAGSKLSTDQFLFLRAICLKPVAIPNHFRHAEVQKVLTKVCRWNANKF